MNPANTNSPIAVVLVDTSGNQLANPLPVTSTGTQTVVTNPYTQAANYTALTTTGTQTIKSGTGVFYGAVPVVLGTLAQLSVFDGTKPISGTSTLSVLNTLLSPVPNIGVAFTTGLITVVSGTASGTINVYWD